MSGHFGNLTLSSRRRLDLASNTPALALAVAAGLHLAAIPDHAREGAGIGAFFLATAVLQLIAAWMVGPGGAGVKARIGIAAGNLALVALWAWSRVAGLPLGGHAGPESVTLLDGLVVAAEIIAVAGLCRSRDVARVRRTGVASGAALLTIMVLSGAGALQWLPANHTSHREHDHEHEYQQERQHEPVHPTAEGVHVTPSSEDDHSGTGVMLAPCSAGCQAHPNDGDSSHDDTAHTHP